MVVLVIGGLLLIVILLFLILYFSLSWLSEKVTFNKVKEKLNKLGFIPVYTEVSLFLMSLTVVLLFIWSTDVRTFIFKLINQDPRSLIALAALGILPILLSIYHVFSFRKKTEAEKGLLFIFAFSINLVAAFASAVYAANQQKGYLLIFPLWNIANAVLMVELVEWKLIDYKSAISNLHARVSEIIVGSVATFILFTVSHFILGNYWAITFSLCVGFASTLSKFTTHIILHRTGIKSQIVS